MSQFVVFMGGTGARIMKAFAYVLSSGAFVSDEPISILRMDSDKANETGEGSARQIMTDYAARQRRAQDGQIQARTTAFKTAVEVSDWIVQPSFLENQPNAKLIDLANHNGEAEGLMRLFYDKKEQDIVPSQYGFVAHPNVGAALIYAAQADSNDEQRGYGVFRNKIATACSVGKTKVILVGSLFGGTGAASFPTVANDIHAYVEQRSRVENLQIGAVMMAPYFKIQDDLGIQDEVNRNGGVRIDSNQFPAAAKRALSYYADRGGAGMDTIYLLGAPVLNTIPEKNAGGMEQRNPSMYPELEAAFAIGHFLQNTAENTRDKVWYKYVEMTQGGENQKMALKWDDLSIGLNGCRSLASMTYFCLFYLYHIYPAYQDHVNMGGGDLYLTECIDPIVNRDSMIMDNLKKYCISYLRWIDETLFGINAERQRNVQQQMVNESVTTSLLNGVLNTPDERPTPAGLQVFRNSRERLFNQTLTTQTIRNKYRDVAHAIVGYDLHNPNGMEPITRFETFFHFVYSMCNF